MVDIYGDLDNFDFVEEVDKLRSENKGLLDRISVLEEEYRVLTQKNTVLEKEAKELRTNISSLLKTSTAEIQRKDRTISELREQVNKTPFRPQGPHKANQSAFPPTKKDFPINANQTELQGRQPEKAYFGIFKQEAFPPQKGQTNRSTYNPSNEERNQTDNTIKNLLSSQETTSRPFASGLGNTLPLKNDTKTSLFGIAQRSENTRSLYNDPKTLSFAPNEISQTASDSVQNSIKMELDQSSSQLYDKVLERRLQLTQMEFERDYSEIENSLRSKPLENKPTLHSPTRKCLSPRNRRPSHERRDDHKVNNNPTSRSRSNERSKKNYNKRSRSPHRNSDHKGFNRDRSNSRERYDNFGFRGRSDKNGRYNERSRRETESRHFPRKVSDRKERYNERFRMLSEDRRRESNASGESIRSSKYSHESGKKPSPESKHISKVSFEERFDSSKEKDVKKEANMEFNDERTMRTPRKKIKLADYPPRHEVHKKSDLSTSDIKQESASQPTDYDIEEGEIHEDKTHKDSMKTACGPVNSRTKDESSTIELCLNAAKEMTESNRSLKVAASPVVHDDLEPTQAGGDLKTPIMTFTEESPIHSSNPPTIKILARPRRNIQYFFTDDDSKETVKTTLQVTVPNLITNESGENAHTCNKSASNTHDANDVKKHLVKPESECDTSVLKKSLEHHGNNKCQTSLSKHIQEKSDSIFQASVPKMNLEKSAVKRETSENKNSLGKCNLKSNTSVPKHHSEKSSINPVQSDSKSNTHVLKNKLARSDLFGDCGEADAKSILECSLSENNLEKTEVKDTLGVKNNLVTSDSTHDTSKPKNQLRKLDSKSDTSKLKTHLENSDSKCDTSKPKNNLEKSDTTKSKTNIENSDSKYDISKHKNHLDKSNTSKPKTHPENSDSKCDTSKPKNNQEKSDTSKPKTHLENPDSKRDTSKPKSNIEKSDTSKPKTYLENSDSKCDTSKPKKNPEKSDTNKPKIHHENSDLKCDTGKHKNHHEKSDTSKPKAHLEISHSKCDPIKSINQLEKSDTKCNNSKPKKNAEKYDLFGEDGEHKINLEKTDLFVSNPKTKSDLKCSTSLSKNIEAKSDSKCESSKHKGNLDKCDTSKTAIDLDKSNEKPNSSEPKKIEDKSIVKCETSTASIVSKTCVTPTSGNTLHVKIFRPKTIIKKL